jgi:hypothetical protein
MRETMEQELAEAIRTLEKANGVLARIFNTKNCAGCGEPYEGEGNCPDCRCGDGCGCTEEERESDE